MNWRKWCDEFILASKGILLATKEKRFWWGFVPTFILFGMLISLLSGGTSKFELMGALGFAGSLKILSNSFLSIFGLNQPFLDWLIVFAISFLQATLIGIIVLLWNKKRPSNPNASKNTENLSSAGIITGLVALGAGCPTCGATLITPLIGAIFSTGGLAIANTVSVVFTWLAIIIAILSLKKLGVEIYVTIINEKYLAKKKEAREQSN